MIRMVVGLPGGGKTYYMVTKIVEELRFTERFIVTNCEELDLPRIREYLQEVEPDREEPIDLDSRLLIIPKEETFRFYRYRSGGLVLPVPVEKGPDDRRLKREEWLAGMVKYFLQVKERPEWSCPVSYFITEAHDYFNAQDWQEVGRSAQYYTSKHRHLHDEVIFESQLVEQCDASMRRLVEQTHEIENHYQRSFGWFANRGCFKRRVYFKMKTPASVPYETSEFKLDAKGIGSCYHTTGALGLLDRGKEAKGFGRVRKLPWWSLWAGGIAAVVAVGFGIAMVPRLIGSVLGSMISGTTAGIEEHVKPQKQGAIYESPSPAPAPAAQNVSALPQSAPAASVASPVYVNPAPTNDVHARRNDVRVTGIVQQGQKIMISLSDGRTFTEADPELGPDSGARVDRNSVTLEGVRYWFAKPMTVYPLPTQSEAPAPGQRRSASRGDFGDRSQQIRESGVSTNDENSAWYLAPDGTYRLKSPETKATAFKPSFSFK